MKVAEGEMATRNLWITLKFVGHSKFQGRFLNNLDNNMQKSRHATTKHLKHQKNILAKNTLKLGNRYPNFMKSGNIPTKP